MFKCVGKLVFLAVAIVTVRSEVYEGIEGLDLISFETRVEVTNKLKDGGSSSSFIEEFHDLEGSRGRVKFSDASIMYYFSKTKEVVSLNVHAHTCDVLNYEESPIFKVDVFWGWRNEKHNIFGPSALLYRELAEKPRPEENEIIRGINCKRFSAKDKDGIVINYYYADADTWIIPDSKILPVRVTFQGQRKSPLNITTDLNQQLDFIKFKPKTSPLRFKIPAGIGCMNLIMPEDNPMPKLTNQFSVIIERFDKKYAEDHADSMATPYQLWFDGKNNFVRVDGNTGRENFQSFDDFNTGLSYYKISNGSCYIFATKSSFAEKFDKNSVGSMKGAMEQLGLDGTFYYLGKDIFRGIYCDVWEAVKTDVFSKEFNKPLKRVVYTIYFMTKEIEAVSAGDVNWALPVVALTKGYLTEKFEEPDVNSVNSFFKFDETKDKAMFLNVDLEDCYATDSQKSYFKIHFPSNKTSTAVAKTQHQDFELQTFENAAVSAKSSLLRIPYTKAYFKENEIVVVGLLLNRPSALKRFFLAGNDFIPTDKMDRGVKAKTTEDCAAQCINLSKFKCRTFTFCNSECYMTSLGPNDNLGTRLDGEFKCYGYTRSVIGKSQMELTLDDSLTSLKETIDNSKFQVSVKDTKGNDYLFTANSFESGVKPFDFQRHENRFESVTTDYQLSNDPEKPTATFEVDVPVGSLEECFSRCQNDWRLACSSFSYCSINGKCRLSETFLDLGDPNFNQEISPATQCSIYRLKAIEFFEPSSGRLRSINSKRTFNNVNNEKECADWCHKETNFDCLAFEFCGTSKGCFLHEKHIPDTFENSDETADCVHYSRKYSTEFWFIGKQRLNDPKALVILGVTFKECTKMCYENYIREKSCLSLNFFSGGTKNGSRCELCRSSILDKQFDLVDDDSYEYHVLNTEHANKDLDQAYSNIAELVNGGYYVHVELTDTREANGVNRTTTYYVDEFHDLSDVGKKGLITRHHNGMLLDASYYFVDTKQVVDITVGGCKVTSYTQTNTFLNESIDWGWLYAESLIAGPSSVLWRETFKLPVYVGKTKIRGIPCHKFEANDKLDTDIKLVYYFSDSSWGSLGSKKLPSPVRVEVTGTYILGTVKIPLNRRLDFIYFHPQRPAPSLFYLPRGVGCEGLHSGSRTLPTLPNQFSMVFDHFNSLDFDDHPDAHIETNRIWYDYNQKLFKLVGTDSNHNRLNYIQDFNTGVSYVFDVDGNCKMEPILKMRRLSSQEFEVKEMPMANELFRLQGDYYYLGKEMMRDVECDVWEVIHTAATFGDGLKAEKIVQTAYFAAEEVREASPSEDNNQLPLSIIIRVFPVNKMMKPFTLTYNSFGSDQSEGRLLNDVMNVEKCYKAENQRSNLFITFKTSDVIMADFYRKIFELEALLTIAANAQVSILRVPTVKLYLSEDEVTVMAVMLERPSALAGFLLASENEPLYANQQQIISVNNEEGCALSCVKGDGSCKGFTMCTNDGKPDCFLRTFDDKTGTKGDLRTDYQNCKLFYRADTNTMIPEPTLDEALVNLEKAVKDGAVFISVPFSFSNSTRVKITASKIEDKLNTFNWHDSDSFETLFTLKRLRSGDNVETIINLENGKAPSVSECYQACLREERINCNTFSYCRSYQECRLSSEYLEVDANSTESYLESATACNVYRKSSMKFFDEYPGTISATIGERIATEAKTASQCAHVCMEERNFTCKGFDFCSTSQGCILQKIHSFDIKPLKEVAPSCTHYALKYSTDFSDMGHFKLIDPSAQTQIGVSFEACAKLCIESKDFPCKSINYCPADPSGGDSLCDVNTKDTSDKKLDFSFNPNCSYYFVNGPVLPPIVIPQEMVQDGITSGRFAGTIIGVMIFGIAIGLAAFLGYSYFRSRHQNADGMAVRFIRTP